MQFVAECTNKCLKNPVYDLAHHKSPAAQWLEHPISIWKVMGSTLIGGLENILFFFFPVIWLEYALSFINSHYPSHHSPQKYFFNNFKSIIIIVMSIVVCFSGQSPQSTYEFCWGSGSVLCAVSCIHDRTTEATGQVHFLFHYFYSAGWALVMTLP